MAMKDKDRRRRGSGSSLPRASDAAGKEPHRRRHRSSAAVESLGRSREAEGIGGIKRRASLGAADLLASGVLALQG